MSRASFRDGHRHRSIAYDFRTRKGERKVGGNERLPISRGRARNAEDDWRITREVVRQRQAKAPERLDRKRHRLDSKNSLTVRFEVRYGAGDCESKLVRRLLRIAESPVESIVQECDGDGESQAGQNSHQQQARCVVRSRENWRHARSSTLRSGAVSESESETSSYRALRCCKDSRWQQAVSLAAFLRWCGTVLRAARVTLR